MKKIKDHKRRWKEHLERMSDIRLAKEIWKYTPIGDTCIPVDPGRDSWSIFAGGTGSIINWSIKQ